MGYRSIDPWTVPARHPVARIRDSWGDLAGPGGTAPWSGFDPLEYPGVLPWVLLLRAEDPARPERLRYAICGDGCRQSFGLSYQGKMFGEDLPAEAVTQRLAEFESIRAGQGPLYSFTPLPVADRGFISVYRGVFGFSAADGAIDRYMVVIAPDNVRVPNRLKPRPDLEPDRSQERNG